jgi:hypothetical protein
MFYSDEPGDVSLYTASRNKISHTGRTHNGLIVFVLPNMALAFVLFFALIAYLPRRAEAQNAQPFEKLPQIESIVANFMSANAVPGLSVAIVEDGQLRWSAERCLSVAPLWLPPSAIRIRDQSGR